MIDVVFLLLVYFMVATEFKVGEEVFRLDLPKQMSSDAIDDPFDIDEEPLRIRVATLGEGATSYRLVMEGPYDQPGTFDDLFDQLQSVQINDVNGGGLFRADHPIIIIPGRTTRWEHTVEAFNAVVRASYSNITLAKPQ